MWLLHWTLHTFAMSWCTYSALTLTPNRVHKNEKTQTQLKTPQGCVRDFTLITCSVYLLALWFLLSSTPWWRSWYQSWALQSSHLLQYLPNMFPWGPEAQKLSAMIIIVSYQWWPYSQLQLLTCLKQLTGAPTVLLLQIYCPQSKLSPATTDGNNN